MILLKLNLKKDMFILAVVAYNNNNKDTEACFQYRIKR